MCAAAFAERVRPLVLRAAADQEIGCAVGRIYPDDGLHVVALRGVRSVELESHGVGPLGQCGELPENVRNEPDCLLGALSGRAAGSAGQNEDSCDYGKRHARFHRSSP
jgi:hypothetical protein